MLWHYVWIGVVVGSVIGFLIGMMVDIYRKTTERRQQISDKLF